MKWIILIIISLIVLGLIFVGTKSCKGIEDFTSSKQQRFEECLTDMKLILDREGQHFFLSNGTLLGAIRNKNFIPHDNDIDIGILKHRFNPKIIKIIKQSDKFKLKRTLGKLKHSYEVTFKHTNGTDIDIFIYYPMDTPGEYYYSTFYGICNKKPGGFCKYKSSIDGFKDYMFLNHTYQIPIDPYKYLREAYGDDWRVEKKFSYMEGISKGLYTNLM